ncbi:MAG TPA: nucleotidyl transferase AbiEii/AbiGii toxin family protein [Pseudobdellovibrionaceae bacterium]
MNITKDIAIKRYKSESTGLSSGDQRNLIREILQETILCHMKEENLFNDFAFHGGTSLRILHRIDRFSEDLDLSLIEPNSFYAFPEKMSKLEKSLKKAGFTFEFQNKCKPENPIKKYFINDTLFLNEFKDQIGNVIDGEKVKIKLELDVEPPEYQEFETFEIKSKFAAKIYAHNLSTCMGQKIHAVLCRGQSYGLDIVKGRDLYDLDWYLKKGVKPNLKNLSSCLNRLGPWKGKGLNVDAKWIVTSVNECLSTKDFDAILSDLKPLVSSRTFDPLKEVWKREYFSKLLQGLLNSQ